MIVSGDGSVALDQGRMIDGSEPVDTLSAPVQRAPAPLPPSEPVTMLVPRRSQPVLTDIAPTRAPAPVAPPASGGGVTFNAPPPPDSSASALPVASSPIARTTVPPAAVRDAERVATDSTRTKWVIAWLLVAAVAYLAFRGDGGDGALWK